MFLSLSIPNPIKTHVHRLGSALDNGVSEDANCAFVVELEWRGTLFVAHFFKGSAHGDSVFGVDETGAGFGFLNG